MRVATYHRASTLDQNPTLAREELRVTANRLGALALEIEEKGSGARNDRPGMRRIMEAAQKGQIDAVVVWKLDRFGRSTLDLLANIEQLHRAGVRFIATTQGLDFKPEGDAMSRLLLTMLAAVAEFERDLIRERTRLGLRAAKRAGKRLGRPPALSDRSVEQARAMRSEGRSWRAIGKALGVSPTTAAHALA